MKTVAAALAALLLLASPALCSKRVMWIDGQGNAADATGPGAQTGSSAKHIAQMWRSIFVLYGINFDYYYKKAGAGNPNYGKTVWRHTGLWPATGFLGSTGTGNAFGIQYDGVIIGGNPTASSGVTSDSSLRAQYTNDVGTKGGPSVPRLIYQNDNGQVSDPWADAACCTTGVSSGFNNLATQGGYFIPGYPGEPTIFGGGWTLPIVLSSSAPPGGIRNLLKHTTMEWDGPNIGMDCLWCDSLYSSASTQSTLPDTSNVWMLLHDSVANPTVSKADILCYPDGSGGITGPTGDSEASEGDPIVMLAALSAYDSLLSGQLIQRRQARGVVIENLCSRSAYAGNTTAGYILWNGPRAYPPSDTATAYASMDSIKGIGARVLYTVNADPDSMLAYKRDLIVAVKNPLAKFTPQVWAGLDSLAVLGSTGGTQNHRPRDVFGRYRNRIAVGDNSGVGSDTSSIVTNLKWARALLDSALTSVGAPGRISTSVVAPDYDWSPRNTYGGVNSSINPVPEDSVLYAISLAGFNVMIVDLQNRNSIGSKDSSWVNIRTQSNPVGYQENQEHSVHTVAGGRDVKILGYNGWEIVGGSGTAQRFRDGTVWNSMLPIQMNRIWAGWTQVRDFQNYDSFLNDSAVSGAGISANMRNVAVRGWDFGQGPARSPSSGPMWPASCSLARFSISDLAGNGNAGSRWGWYCIKSLYFGMSIFNRLAGRPIWTMTYPEYATR